MNSKEIG